MHFFEAVPGLNGNTRRRRGSFERGYVLSRGKLPATGRFDQSLNFGGILFQVSVQVCDSNFADVVDGWLGLSVQTLNRDRAKSGS